jgi:hypothetical protein
MDGQDDSTCIIWRSGGSQKRGRWWLFFSAGCFSVAWCLTVMFFLFGEES